MLCKKHSGEHLLISGKRTLTHVGLSRNICGLGFLLKDRRVQLAMISLGRCLLAEGRYKIHSSIKYLKIWLAPLQRHRSG